MDRLDAIKARAEWAKQVAGDLDANAFVTYRDSANDVPRLLAAIEAVLAIHERVNVDWLVPALCEHCSDSDWEQVVEYPCQTVETIELVLEEKQ